MGPKVEYPSGLSGSLPPGLVSGGDNRKLGVTEMTEQKGPIKQDQKRENVTTPVPHGGKTSKMF